MMFGAVVLALLSVVNAQAAIDIAALAQTDFSSAAAAAQGIGADVVGDVIAAADENSAFSSSVVTATGDDDDDDDDDVVIVDPKPKYPKIPKVEVVKPKPYSKYYPYYYSCEDLKDDKCYEIDDYVKCGFCYTPKVYPAKGYACKYYEDIKMVKKGKKYEYVTEYVPYCECDGYFVTEGKYCPSCDMLLAELLECAGIEEIPDDGEIEIPASCLEEIDCDEDYLKKCDFFGKKDPYYGKKADKPVYTDPKYLYVKPKYPFVEAFASAQATAKATGGSIANAVASAFAEAGDK